MINKNGDYPKDIPSFERASPCMAKCSSLRRYYNTKNALIEVHKLLSKSYAISLRYLPEHPSDTMYSHRKIGNLAWSQHQTSLGRVTCEFLYESNCDIGYRFGPFCSIYEDILFSESSRFKKIKDFANFNLKLSDNAKVEHVFGKYKIIRKYGIDGGFKDNAKEEEVLSSPSYVIAGVVSYFKRLFLRSFSYLVLLVCNVTLSDTHYSTATQFGGVTLAAGITHGQEGRVLTDVAAYNPSTEANYIFALQQLQSVNFSLLAELKSNKDASVETIMKIPRLEESLAERLGLTGSQPHVDQLMVPIHHSADQHVVGASALSLSLDVSSSRVWRIKENITHHRSALRDIFVPLSEPLSITDLTCTKGTSEVMPVATVITTALSVTSASASLIYPISTDDYEVAPTGQEGVGA
ncbi:hypothetical protein Tco_0205149 [Tanacetum coccineum]